MINHKHNPTISIAFSIILFILISGCKIAPYSRLSESEKSNLGKISIQPASSNVDIKFGSLLTENPAEASAKGAGAGFLIGLNPYLLVVGGPIFMPSITATKLKKCAEQLQPIEDPEKKFIAAVLEIRPYEIFSKKTIR